MTAIASISSASISSPDRSDGDHRDSRRDSAGARRRSPRAGRASEEASASRFLLTLLGASLVAACIGGGAAVFVSGAPAGADQAGTTPTHVQESASDTHVITSALGGSGTNVPVASR